MALFDLVNFNGEVFDAVVRETPNLRLNELLKSRAIVEKPEYAGMLPDQKGGHFITTLIKERLSGNTVNYDGSTNITSASRGNFAMGRIVVGRAQGWTEKDFNTDINGEDYSAAAGEVAEFWDDVDQNTLISTLKGIFSMASGAGATFATNHTYTADTFGATTLNTAMQKCLGDKKSKFALAVMHSSVATELENLNLLEYMKYTDDAGIERALPLATLNGRVVLVDDTMPAAAGFKDATSSTAGAVKVVASGASTGEINLADVTPYFGSRTLAANDYVVAATQYTTYVLGEGAIEYTNCGVKVPSELQRDAKTNGGETDLITRQRKVFAPFGISWKSPAIISPTAAQLETGTNWELAKNGTNSYPEKAIAIAQIKTLG